MIHSTAIIAETAEIGENVEIGPYAIIEDHTIIGDNCRIGPKVSVMEYSRIGSDTRVHNGAVIGDLPQDYHFGGERSYTEIGSGCVVREYVTIHRGTEPESVTRVGDNVMLMALSHVGHNVRIGANAVIVNAVLLGGYVEIGDNSFISGAVLVHQFVRIGRLAMVGGGSFVTQDVPPFCILQFGGIQGVNSVGLKRSEMPVESRKAVRQTFKIFFRQGLNSSDALARIRDELPGCPEAEEFVEFVENSQRGVQAANSRNQKSKV